MKNFLKWSGLILGILLLATMGLVINTNARQNRDYNIQLETLKIPSNTDPLDRGEHLANIYCSGCHGEDFGGKAFFDDPALAVVDAPNLTSGEGGIGGSYSGEDWVRSIRHGVGPDGKPLFVMPSSDFYYFSDEDLGQIIAYIKTVPSVDRESQELQLGLVGKIMAGLRMLDIFTAENIPHEIRPESIPVGVTTEYGEYLVNTFGCKTCHGDDLAGGKNPEPGAPPGPNLTPTGNMANFTDKVFIDYVRIRESQYMPFETLAKMSDDELTAIWLYLESLPALADN